MSDQRFNTGNPIGSNSPLDRSDNTRNLDVAVNAEQLTWVDRLGRDRKSFEGMESEFDADQAERVAEFSADQTSREQEFDADQIRREDEFQALLLEQGYQELGAYEDGPYTIEYLNQVFSHDGYLYRLSPSTSLPYTTQGVDEASWDAEKANFVQVDFVTAQNFADERQARQDADANLQSQISGGTPLEASAFSPISWHDQSIESSVTIPNDVNAWSFGPTMVIADGQQVTVGVGSFWTIANGEVQ